MNDGKRRTISQRIGKKGEHLFAAWAVDMNLTANKCEEDIGVDFFCQALTNDGRVAGPILAIQVKSSDTFANKRLVLTRDDVISALQVEHPFCLVGVDTASRRGRVGFRFLDRELFSLFQNFLRSNRDTWSMRFQDLATDEITFRSQLERVGSPGAQQQLRLLREQEQLRRSLPLSTITIQATADFVRPIVDLPWLGDAFEIDPAQRGEVLRRVLVDGEIPAHTIPGLRIREALKTTHRLSDGSGILVRGLICRDSNLVLTNGETKISLPVKVRTMGGDVAWATKTGLVITCGEAISIDGGPTQHRLGWSITRQGVIRLGESADEMEFLRNFRPEAQLSFGAEWGLKLWGLLDCIGDMVAALELVCATIGIALTDFTLADFESSEFRLSVMVLDAVARGIPLQDYMPGFVLGPADQLKRASNRPGWYEVPLVANLGDHGIVVWLRGKCLLWVAGGEICGFQPLSQIYTRWERRARLATGGRPQLWVHSEWPGIEVVELAKMEGEGIQAASHEFGGRMWFGKAAAPSAPMPSEWLEPGLDEEDDA